MSNPIIERIQREVGVPNLLDVLLERLTQTYPASDAHFDPQRESGRGYYVGACFDVYVSNGAGDEFQLIDGGFTTWTQQLLSNAKERLLISGLGTELLCSQFNTAPTRAD